ncbi:MAG: aldolase/citrate lyase family protein [Steroidobacteraceae bacterium]
MDIQRNAFKQALQQQQLQIGLWSSLCSNLVAEILSQSGFDWIVLDTEHAPNELPDLVRQLQAMARGSATPVVRAAWNDTVLIKRILDLGAQSILLPYVQSAEEAARAVAAVRYPPRGVRGVSAGSRASNYGRISNYLQHADEQICLLLQVETRAGLEQLEAIARVDGVDGVFIGPADLAASLGHLGDPQHPEIQRALEDAGRLLSRLKRPAGILATLETDARRYMHWGYNFVAVGIDTGLLTRSADALARTFRAPAA